MKKGFTLIELLVTLAIIGTLVGVGIFIYNGYLKSAKASATITQFKMVENHIKNTLALCFTKGGGSVELNGNRSIDCDAANNWTLLNETFYRIRDGIPDYLNIKEEVMVNFYEDKTTVILVEASSLRDCNPEISVFYE